MEELLKEYRKARIFHNDTLELMGELKLYGLKDALRGIIDDKDIDDHMKNTAKYYMYWLEKRDTIDDPEKTKYNDYDEDQLGKI